MSQERKFARTVSKPGMAAQVRVTVAQAVRESTSLTKPKLVEPIDFETFLLKNKTILQNDPQRELVLFPSDDVSQEILPRRYRTLLPSVPPGATEDASHLFVQECIKSYTNSWNIIHYKYNNYGKDYWDLPKTKSKPENLPEQVYELDEDIESKDEEHSISNGVFGETITKKGILYKCTQSGNGSIISLGTKSFKRRYAYLRRLVDGTYMLEFFKVDKKNESKGAIYLDFYSAVAKSVKKGKFAFELKLADTGKDCVLAAESEEEMADWINTLKTIILETHSNKLLERISISLDQPSVAAPPSPSLSEREIGTMRESLEQSMNPELVKYARETDQSLSQARKENRQQLFGIYPEMQRSGPENEKLLEKLEPYKECFGYRFMVKCENLNFRLQTKTNDSERGCCQVEPFFTSMALYDMKLGKKISEEFRFDMNNSHMRAMLPRERLSCSESSQPNGLSHKSCFPDLGHLSEDWLRYPSQGIFSVLRPDSDIYLVVRIEKVLQGSLAQSVDPYLRNGDPKLGLKVYKVAKTFCNRLGHYRMPFGWAAKPVFRPSGGDLDTDPYINTIYKCESSRISDEDLIKFLSDFKKQEKISKLQIIPGQIKLTIEPFKLSHPNILTSSLVPIRPFPDPPTHALSLEIEEFGPETGSTSYPFTTYTNNLYVYPKSLKYDNQKTFTKARNIACVVEFRDNDEEGSLPLKKIYSRPGMPVFSTYASAAVLHHNSCPEFYEEVKIALPTQLTEKHHVLFTFYHVSCDQAKGSSKRREQVETVVGFSWLPVLYKGRVNIQEHSLTVAAHLPPGYLSCQHLGLGKGFTMPDVRWVDGGKQLFRMEFKLASTIYTKDQHMHNFFAHCQRIRTTRSPSSDSETSKFLKTLHAVDVSTFIMFAPTILNQLLKLLPYATNEDVSLNIIRVIIHFVHEAHVVGKSDVLRTYLKYVFMTESTNNRNGINSNTVHEELAKSLTVTLRPANADVVIINKFLKHAWFIFGILIKSMAQYLLSTGRIKMYRNERFSPDYQYRIQNLLQALMSHIIQKFKEIPDETRHANRSLAEFVKNCFIFMDRGFVFRLINLYLDRFNPGDPKALCELKFEFLQIVCNHEYFIPLNLPLCSGSAKGPKNFKDMEQLYRLSDEFCKNHFLVGSLLQEVKSALNELNETRKCAITVLRNLLAKHAFDERYQNASQQARIASLYLPFLSIILENVYRLNNKDGITPCPSMITNESITPEIPPTPVAHHRHTISLDNSFSNLNSSFKMSRESSFFALTAGQIANGNLPYLQLGGGSNESLSSNSSTVTLPSNEQDKPEVKERSDSLVVVKSARSESKSHARNLSQSFSQNPLLIRYDKLDQQEVKDLLVCLLYILKNISAELLIGWWQHCNEYDILDFFHVLEICLYTFRYIGKKQICSSSSSNTTKAMTLPARKAISFIPPRNASLSAKNPTSSYPGQVDAEALYRALLEANMATEVGLITLDVLGLYCNEFKIQLQYQDGDNTIMRKVFDIYISFLQVGQSETLLKHVFAALRSFINKFPTVLFNGNALICGTLCYEILKCCNSRLTTTRHEACALLYLLMRSNFEFASKKNFTRVHLQVIISVSQLLGDIVGLINSRFQESLSLINNYANSDKAMKSTAFPKEVKDLTKRIRTVLMATSQMKEHENDPEMLVDLQYSLANSYASTPELRRTWLESMARIHVKNGEMSEAAHCYIHIAALVAEYLKIKGLFPEGCWAFQEITSNVLTDESNMKEDSGMQDIHYTEETLLEKLELCAEYLGKAERYEDMSKIYRLIIPIYEKHRNFQALAEVYKTLHTAYSKIVELTRTGRRLLGKYYRIAFFGQAYLEDEKEKEYIYKEPKITTLAEISEKLLNLYTEKFGQGTVKLIQDSKQVDTKELDPKYLYIQVTHVTPYFTEDELDERLTDFEKNNHINKFMFETPFTLDGLRARGTPEEQCKRRTILTSAYYFPYVKKRIPVLSRQVYELSPIEVAIDEMETRVGELNDVINTSPPDLKKLQLKLQGSVSVTVNSGPLTYASIFLEEKNVHKYPRDKVRQLKEIYRKFVQACSESLDLNGRLISADQFEYQEAMKRNFKDLVDELSGLLHDKVYNLLTEDRVSSLNRTSLTLFNYISGTPGSSAV